MSVIIFILRGVNLQNKQKINIIVKFWEKKYLFYCFILRMCVKTSTFLLQAVLIASLKHQISQQKKGGKHTDIDLQQKGPLFICEFCQFLPTYIAITSLQKVAHATIFLQNNFNFLPLYSKAILV